MRLTMGLLASICAVGLSISATAQQTPSSSSSASTSSSADKPASTPASSDKPQITADDKRLIAQGYKLKMNKGQKVFCRMETAINSRFEHSVCATADEILKRQQTAQDSFDATRRVNIGGSQ